MSKYIFVDKKCQLSLKTGCARADGNLQNLVNQNKYNHRIFLTTVLAWGEGWTRTTDGTVFT